MVYITIEESRDILFMQTQKNQSNFQREKRNFNVFLSFPLFLHLVLFFPRYRGWGIWTISIAITFQTNEIIGILRLYNIYVGVFIKNEKESLMEIYKKKRFIVCDVVMKSILTNVFLWWVFPYFIPLLYISFSLNFSRSWTVHHEHKHSKSYVVFLVLVMGN